MKPKRKTQSPVAPVSTPVASTAPPASPGTVIPIAASVGMPLGKPIEMAESTKPRKLDLACGQSPREGFEGVDFYAPSAHKVDLLKFPWPWDDNSIDELHCSHFVEHIHARQVEPRDLVDDNPMTRDRFVGKDMFFAFFDECWRILRAQGTMLAIVPALRTNRAFQDPTHRRFIPAEMFFYLDADWRKMNKLDHYLVHCNFGGNIVHTTTQEMNARHQEVQARMFSECWNVMYDYHATLVAKK